jgi:hypothetical protein
MCATQRLVAVLMLLSIGLVPACGQPSGVGPCDVPAERQAAAKGAVEKLLKQIPPDRLAVLVIPNLRDFSARLDGFLKQVLPAKALGDFKLMEFVVKGAELGTTFDPNGALAVVVFDPKKYAPDMAKPLSEEDSDRRSYDTGQLPGAYIFAGRDIAKMFAAHEPQKEGDYLKMGSSDTYLLELDGCVVASRQKNILDEFIRQRSGSPRTAAKGPSAAHMDLIARNDASLWVNWKMWDSLRNTPARKAIGQVFDDLTDNHGIKQMLLGLQYVRLTRGEALRQAEQRTFGVRLSEKGMMVEVRGSYNADSLLGKALAAYKPSDKPLMSRLPNFPYVFAYGARKETKTPSEIKAEQYNTLFDHPEFNVRFSTKIKARNLILAIHEEVTAVQHYLGGQGPDGGPIGMVTVVECKSAQNLKKLVREAVPVAAECMKALKGTFLEEFVPEYVEDLDKVGDLRIDAIVIEHPSLAKMEKSTREALKAFLGEDKLCARIAQTDNNTLVVAFGGGTKFMEEAIKASRGEGRIEQDPAVVAAMSALPKDRAAAALINVGNAWNLLMAAYASGGADSSMSKVKLASKAPVAAAVSIDKTDVTFVAYVPAEPIREVLKILATEEVEIREYRSQEKLTEELGPLGRQVRDRYDTIRVGQSEAEVEKALGKPQVRSPGTWTYIVKDPPVTIFIEFKDGKVVQKVWYDRKSGGELPGVK